MVFLWFSHGFSMRHKSVYMSLRPEKDLGRISVEVTGHYGPSKSCHRLQSKHLHNLVCTFNGLTTFMGKSKPETSQIFSWRSWDFPVFVSLKPINWNMLEKTLSLRMDLSMSRDVFGIQCGQTWGLQRCWTCFNSKIDTSIVPFEFIRIHLNPFWSIKDEHLSPSNHPILCWTTRSQRQQL